jgi:hypothetical protein
MKITIIVEGRTEKVFIPQLRSFLVTRLSGRMPTIHPNVYNGRIPKKKNSRRLLRTSSTERPPQTM